MYTRSVLRANDRHTASSIVRLLLLAPVAAAVFACIGTAHEMTDTASSRQDRDSAYWARKVQALKEVALPDEWYQLSIPDTGARIDEMLRLVNLRTDLSKAAKSDLLKRLENGGQPFIHRVFFNRPMPRGARGEPTVGEGLITAVSMKNRASVAIRLSEMREVMENGARFSSERIAQIESVFR